MPNQFLERHKRKSLWALLLLLLRWKRGAGPALVTVILLMLAFAGPRRAVGWMALGMQRLPYGQGLAARLSRLAQERPSSMGLSEFAAALRAARNDRSAGWGLFARGGGGKAAADSLGFVRASQADLLAPPVAGVLSPEGSRKSRRGVELDEQDIQGEREQLARSAFAAGLPGASALDAGRSGAAGAAGGSVLGSEPGGKTQAFVAGVWAYATSGFFKSDAVRAAPSAGAAGGAEAAALGGKAPTVAMQRVAGERGLLSKPGAAQVRQGVRGLSNALPVNASASAIVQLADGHVRSKIARDPNCKPDNGCPPEYASSNTGAVYDGNKIGPAGPGYISSGAPVDGITTASVNPPNEATLASLQGEANAIVQDQKACEAAQRDPVYGLNARLACAQSVDRSYQGFMDTGCQDYGNSTNFFSALLCFIGIGDCDKRRRCKDLSQHFALECLKCDRVMVQADYACPLTRGSYAPQDCSHISPGSGAHSVAQATAVY